jgi:hypothetical protein
VAAIARLPDVGAAAGELVLTEIKTTIPADNMPSPSNSQPLVQVSVTGVDLGHPGLGPLATARLVSSRTFAPDLYIPMARAQALAKLGGQVNIVYVPAASAAAVGAVTGEISRLLPSARVTNSASLAGGLGEQRVSHHGRHGVSRYADIVCGRETLGRPIGVADAQIAAICRTAEATLATRHTDDFSGTGIELINPWKLDRPEPA